MALAKTAPRKRAAQTHDTTHLTTVQRERLKQQQIKAAAVRVKALNRQIADKGMSQYVLADKAKTSQPHICNILNGVVVNPREWTLTKMEKAVAAFKG